MFPMQTFCVQCKVVKERHKNLNQKLGLCPSMPSVYFGLYSCTLYCLSQTCQHMKNPREVMFDLKKMIEDTIVICDMLNKHFGFKIYSFHITFTPNEHIHSWIHTHEPTVTRRSKIEGVKQGKLLMPLSQNDPLVLLGADAEYGTLEQNAVLRGSREGGDDSQPWANDFVSKKYDLSQDSILFITNFIICTVNSESDKIYLYVEFADDKPKIYMASNKNFFT